jgi:uncharacterized protein (TIGR03435 family)
MAPGVGLQTGTIDLGYHAGMLNRVERGELSVGLRTALALIRLTTLVASVAIGVVATVAIQAQSPAVPQPQFDVASIRLSKNPEPGGNVEITPGRFRGKDLALQWLILTAYRIKSGNLSGDLPSWTIDLRYDIDANTGDSSGEDQILLALQTLLRDRFNLRLHREMRQEPVYFLKVGKNGITMPPGRCVPVKMDFPNECWGQGADGLIRTLDWRGVRMSDPTGVAYRSLAGQLAASVQRPVIDKTGLTGTFDVHLRWAVEPAPTVAAGALPDTAMPTADLRAPSIFDAVEEQLGLTLESGRGPVEHLVVDHAEKPSEN